MQVTMSMEEYRELKWKADKCGVYGIERDKFRAKLTSMCSRFAENVSANIHTPPGGCVRNQTRTCCDGCVVYDTCPFEFKAQEFKIDGGK